MRIPGAPDRAVHAIAQCRHVPGDEDQGVAHALHRCRVTSVNRLEPGDAPVLAEERRLDLTFAQLFRGVCIRREVVVRLHCDKDLPLPVRPSDALGRRSHTLGRHKLDRDLGVLGHRWNAHLEHTIFEQRGRASTP